jgi:hypothetical protein
VAREVRGKPASPLSRWHWQGFRETIVRDQQNRVERHFVICRLRRDGSAGEPVLNES